MTSRLPGLSSARRGVSMHEVPDVMHHATFSLFFVCYNKFMKVVEHVTIAELREMAEKMYGSLVKADVDIAKHIIIIDMGMHADGEAYLLENGSQQNDIWGFNLHPADYGTDDFIEFDSMINIRPRQANASKEILDPELRKRIINLVHETVHD